ncbi:hypothetical protein RA969_003884, partial [Cronobacter sakazakii]|nr:hypothetical protein [Cronobacter sakazakii]
IDKSINDVYLFFLEYVRRLQNNNNFPPADVFTEHYPIQDSAYGYGFWIKDSYRHYSVQLNKILERQQYISLRKKYPSFLIEIKRNLKEDTEKFCEQISRNGIRETNIYGYIGILSSFKPYEFVDMWLSIEITKWHSVREALVNRYSGGSLQGDLVEEREWLKNIKVNIKHRASKLHGIDKLRILRLMMGL